MEPLKRLAEFQGSHFVLKSQLENVLNGTDNHITVYTKIGYTVERVCNRTEAKIDGNEIVVGVSDWLFS